jgi:hypothetical protein
MQPRKTLSAGPAIAIRIRFDRREALVPDRHRLHRAGDPRALRRHEHEQRDEDGPERREVPERIERQPAERFRRRIPELVGDDRVPELVDEHREDEDDQIIG